MINFIVTKIQLKNLISLTKFSFAKIEPEKTGPEKNKIVMVRAKIWNGPQKNKKLNAKSSIYLLYNI